MLDFVSKENSFQTKVNPTTDTVQKKELVDNSSESVYDNLKNGINTIQMKQTSNSSTIQFVNDQYAFEDTKSDKGRGKLGRVLKGGLLGAMATYKGGYGSEEERRKFKYLDICNGYMLKMDYDVLKREQKKQLRLKLEAILKGFLENNKDYYHSKKERKEFMDEDQYKNIGDERIERLFKDNEDGLLSSDGIFKTKVTIDIPGKKEDSTNKLRGDRYESAYARKNGKAVILFSGSGGTNKDQLLPIAEQYAQQGYICYGIDYRGFGQSGTEKITDKGKKFSSGMISENRIYEDSRIIYNYVLKQGFSPNNIILHGFSLGGAVASNLAVEISQKAQGEGDDYKLGGLVMHSPMTSTSEMGKDQGNEIIKGIGGLLGSIKTKGAMGSMSTKKNLLALQELDADLPIAFMSGVKGLEGHSDHLDYTATGILNYVEKDEDERHIIKNVRANGGHLENEMYNIDIRDRYNEFKDNMRHMRKWKDMHRSNPVGESAFEIGESAFESSINLNRKDMPRSSPIGESAFESSISLNQKDMPRSSPVPTTRLIDTTSHTTLKQNSPIGKKQVRLGDLANHRGPRKYNPVGTNYSVRHTPSSEQTVQGKFESSNNTGLPDGLKTNIESLSGYSMNDVKVHYNSPKPAQMKALAYTQGTDIHVAPGQEKHLGHEAWHVVQQKQGRVQPTTQMKGVNINDNVFLEREADIMGTKATQLKAINNKDTVQKKTIQ